MERILVCNGAHIGDVILTTAVLPVLKSAFPQAKIGMLIGSWARPVVEHHTHVDALHIFDHPAHNRSETSRAAKKRRGSKTWRQAVKEVGAYDLAFDMYSLYQANAGRLLAASAIPTRVGAWFSPTPYYYNRLVFWNDLLSDQKLHLVESHGCFLREFGIEEEHLAHLKPLLTYRDTVREVPLPSRYVVVHVGVGHKSREWNAAGWKRLAHHLDTIGLPLVFVGRGKKERREIDQMTQGLKHPLNLCDALSWRELIPLIGKATLLVGLESMAGHVAAYTQTPAVVIYGGSAKVSRWRPYSPYCHVALPEVMHFDATGHAPPAAIHTITAEDVFEKVKLALATKIE